MATTSLEEAKANYEQIKKFATDAAKKEFENEINDRVNKIIKEALSVEVDDEGNATIIKDEKVVELTNDGEVEVEDLPTHEEESDENHFEDDFENDDDEEIEIEKNIDEMITFENEQPENQEAIPAETPMETPIEVPAETPAETNPTVSDDVLELAQLLDKIIDKKIGGGEPSDSEQQGVDVDYIDDETSEIPAAPAAAPAAAPVAQQTPAPSPQPVQEDDELLEFSLDEIENFSDNSFDEFDDDETMDFEIPDEDEDIEDEDIEAMLSAQADMLKEPSNWKENVKNINVPNIDNEEEIEIDLDEIKGQGKIFRNTSSRLGLEPREGTPNLNEAVLKKQKALYESKLDELKKENKRLLESSKEMKIVIKDYQNSFKDLRKQFDEMQSFNAKLAYANKIFASGGFSTTDKAKIAEEFDKAKTVEDAKKLYDKIINENKVVVSKDNISKIKAPTTNTIASKDKVFESDEMRRIKFLAGIEKNEDYI